MINAAQANALATVNGTYKTLNALRSLESFIAISAGEGRTSLTLIARSFEKDPELLATLTDLGYQVSTLDRDDGDWELTVDWSI